MRERQWNDYFREARKYLYCTRQDQKVFEVRVRSAVLDMESEQPGITFEQCVKIIGVPEEAALEYMEGFSTEYLAEQRRRQTLWTRLLFTGALCALAALLILIVCEAVTLNLVTIWFAVGAAAAMFVSAFSVTPRVQFAVFVIVSAVSLAVIYPFARQYAGVRRVRTNADRNIGRRARVLTDITPNEPGRVRLDGVDWQARCGQPLPAGAPCEVERVDGATLTVRAVASYRGR